MERLEALIELRDALRPQVLSEHTEHGLQGVSGLVGQYVKVLAEIAELEPKKAEGDGIDEIATRRAARRAGPATGSPRSKRSS